MITNGGYMPVWQPSIIAAGLPINEVGSAFHKIVGDVSASGITGSFLAQAGPLGDIIPIPVPGLRNVASIGDVFLAAGLAFFLFATTVRTPRELAELGEAEIRRRIGLGPAEEVVDESLVAFLDAGSLVPADALQRPLVLGGSSLGSEGTYRPGLRRVPFPTVPPILERVRRHPYVRLALDSSFSALWTGQLISLLGDRVHQVALAFLVLAGDRIADRGRRGLPRRDAAEPPVRADRRHARRPLGPPRGDDRQ